MDNSRQFVTLFVAIGVMTLLGGGFYAYVQFSFLGRCVGASGTVVGLHWETVSDYDGVHEYSHPVISFRDSSGVNATGVGSVGSNPPDYEVGDVVDVLYIPGESTVYVDTFWDVWMGPIIALVLGSAFVLVGLLVWRFAGVEDPDC